MGNNRKKASNALLTHPNYLKGLERGLARSDDGTQDFRETTFRDSLLTKGYNRDSRGVPIHPEYATILKYGAVTGPGFYWDYGPNPSANTIILGEHEGKLQLAVIEKEDDGRIFIPGGMIDPGEDRRTAAIREAAEEIAFAAHADDYMIDLPAKPLGTRRTTLNAWEESASTLVIPKNSDVTAHPLECGDDATSAVWIQLNNETLQKLFLPHANDVRLAVLAYEKHAQENGQKLWIGADGIITRV